MILNKIKDVLSSIYVKVSHFIHPNKVCKNAEQAMAAVLETSDKNLRIHLKPVHPHILPHNDWMLLQWTVT